MNNKSIYISFINNIINDTPEYMQINNNDETYILLDRLVLSLNENAMTWLFKVYLENQYNIISEDKLTDYIKEKYNNYSIDIYNSNGNLFINKDLILVILIELDKNNQLTFDKENIKLK